MTQTRMTRRHALRFPPILAAALALPLGNAAAEAAETVDPEIVHPAMCFHDKYAVPCDRPAWLNAMAELRTQLTPEQWALHCQISDMEVVHRGYEHDLFIEELCRHFPGLAPAIRAVAYHVDDTRFSEMGSCCHYDEDDDETGGAA
jgi:hypothetical protein